MEYNTSEEYVVKVVLPEKDKKLNELEESVKSLKEEAAELSKHLAEYDNAVRLLQDMIIIKKEDDRLKIDFTEAAMNGKYTEAHMNCMLNIFCPQTAEETQTTNEETSAEESSVVEEESK